MQSSPRERAAGARLALRRRRAWLLLLAGVAMAAAGGAARAPQGVVVVAVEAPSPEALELLAAAPDVDVRWVESGLVVCEVRGLEGWPAALAGRVVAERPSGLELGILRAPEVGRWKPGGGSPQISTFLAGARVASLRAQAGETWILLAEAGAWPHELLGCHSGLVRPGHDVDPRSLIDRGPPPALAAWLARGPRPLTPGQLRVLAEVSEDSLAARLDTLTRAPSGQPADRYVFNADLDGVYALRLQSLMNDALQGLTGASVRIEPFRMVQRITGPPAARDTSFHTAHNIVARLPGSVPGTGTFVVCGHVDATGSQAGAWVDAVTADPPLPVQTPGAEDNASGVACVLEMLRCVAAGVRAGEMDFAFDLEFIAFSGEEVPSTGGESGLTGSTRYVEARVDSGQTLLGAFNLDMVGYETPLDGIPDRLQIVHNPASRWLVEEVLLPGAAASGVALPLVPEQDEGRASDHNSFWNVNAPAILAADAPVSALRGYPTYHRPIDLPASVRLAKLARVTRVLIAGLSRFDTSAHVEPRLIVTDADLVLTTVQQGSEVPYIRGFHRLWPGTPLHARLAAHSVGAAYDGPLRVELAVVGDDGRRPVYDREENRVLPTGGQLEVELDVPIVAAEEGPQSLEARVTYTPPGGAAVVQTARAAFDVLRPDLQVAVLTNPVRNPSPLRLRVNRPGDVRIDVFDLEGERVLSTRKFVAAPDATPRDFSAEVSIDGGVARLAGGVYVVRVQYAGDGATSLARLVVLE